MDIDSKDRFATQLSMSLAILKQSTILFTENVYKNTCRPVELSISNDDLHKVFSSVVTSMEWVHSDSK